MASIIQRKHPLKKVLQDYMAVYRAMELWGRIGPINMDTITTPPENYKDVKHHELSVLHQHFKEEGWANWSLADDTDDPSVAQGKRSLLPHQLVGKLLRSSAAVGSRKIQPLWQR